MLPSRLRAFLGYTVAAALVAGTAGAAVDPDLIVLDAKVNGVGAGLGSLSSSIGVVDAQLQAQFASNEIALLQLFDARRRQFESVLLECALTPGKCIPPAILISPLDPKCMIAPPLRSQALLGPHTHDVGFACPLEEIIKVVKMDRDASEAGGLPRDYAQADRHLAAAEAARLQGDGRAAFEETCAAFRQLACPDRN